MNHVMLDLETWGRAPGCAIRSIGAVVFSPLSGATSEWFYANVDKASCLEAGLVIDPRTEEWWGQQSPEAQAALEVNVYSLRDAAKRFFFWFEDVGGKYLWAHGAGFDPPILQAAMQGVWDGAPWKYWDVRDTRTLFHLADVDLKTIHRVGTHHNAIGDCFHQIKGVAEAYQRLGK